MNYTEKQFNKLPKWAQSEIRRLEGDNKYFEERLQEYEGKMETNTYLHKGIDNSPLPNNSCVKFCANKQESISVYVMADGLINVNCDSRNGTRAVILPQASNVFNIKFV